MAGANWPVPVADTSECRSMHRPHPTCRSQSFSRIIAQEHLENKKKGARDDLAFGRSRRARRLTLDAGALWIYITGNVYQEKPACRSPNGETALPSAFPRPWSRRLD